jgi:hypothetical protein
MQINEEKKIFQGSLPDQVDNLDIVHLKANYLLAKFDRYKA